MFLNQLFVRYGREKDTMKDRSLQNFLALRTSKAALWEIQQLCDAIYKVIPSDHKFLFEHCVQGDYNE